MGSSSIGQTFEVGPGGVQVYPHGEGGCRELRAAGMHKGELGESGQGNTAPAIERCAARAVTILSYHRHEDSQD